MTTKRKIAQYAKKKEGSGDCSSMLIDELKKATSNRNIDLPKYISFILDGNSRLIMYIQEQTDTNGEPLNALSQNMQNDNSAFEGWAVVLKALLPNMIHKVELKWDVPADEKKHYNRFCYRVLKMTEAFNWFSIASSNQKEIEDFKTRLCDLQNNCGNTIPQKKFKHGGEVGENAVEYDMVHEQNFSKLLCEQYNIPKIHHQLPVGVKQNGNSFFAGNKAAIDLWGMNENELTIIELKYKNKMVGIISELFFYASLMRDIVLGRISKPKAKLSHEKELYDCINQISIIHARMLADEYHPLVDNECVFTLLNDNQLKQVKIDFDKTVYSYKPSTLTIP